MGLRKLVLWDKSVFDFEDDPKAFVDRNDLKIGQEYIFLIGGDQGYKIGDRVTLYSKTRNPEETRRKIGIIEILNIIAINKPNSKFTIGKYKYKELYDQE